MKDILESYRAGAADALVKVGASRETAVKIADTLTSFRKEAAGFLPFGSDYEDDSSSNWSRYLLPLLGIAAAGYIGYQARDKGYGDRSAVKNVKNYLLGTARNLFRRRNTPYFNYDSLLGNRKISWENT